MSAPLLLVAPNFPSPGTARDGQAIYTLEAARALQRLCGARILVAAMRLGDQAPHEEAEGMEIRRAEPATPVGGVFELYAPERFPVLLEPLSRLAAQMARTAA
ncbi:MAG TPA: hypothetical protein DFS52_21460, partial [Myxococcales bacterium]|nr:hypothetical protein [Myxococcales bacterium]